MKLMNRSCEICSEPRALQLLCFSFFFPFFALLLSHFLAGVRATSVLLHSFQKLGFPVEIDEDKKERFNQNQEVFNSSVSSNKGFSFLYSFLIFSAIAGFSSPSLFPKMGFSQ